MDLKALTNTVKVAGNTPATKSTGRLDKRAGKMEFSTRVFYLEGPVTLSELHRIRTAKGCQRPKTRALEQQEVDGYNTVKALLIQHLRNPDAMSRAQIIQRCARVPGLGQRNVNTICHALLNR